MSEINQDHYSLETKIWIMSVKYLVFSGGAQKGNAFLGAIKILDDVWKFCDRGSFLSQIDGFGGTSVGALLALACAMKLPTCTIREWFLKQDTEMLITEGVNNLRDMYTNCGLLHTEIIANRVINLLKFNYDTEQKCNDLTFENLYRDTRKTLKVVTSNLSRGTIEVFDNINTPNVRVVDAVTMSMNIPFLIEPFLHNGEWYADGGLYNNFPIMLFPSDGVLGLRIRGKHMLPKSFSFQEYAMYITLTTMEIYEDKFLTCLPTEYQDKTITIQLPPCTLMEMINADRDVKNEYMRLGEQSVINFLFRGFVMGQLLLWMMKLYWEETKSLKKKDID